MIKTHKSFTKRLKMTRTGKVLARKAGQNHFNAKENAKKGANKRRMNRLVIDSKPKSFLLATI